MSASGVAYLSMDSLVFTTSGEISSALSILQQGTSAVAAGQVFGRGVRCAGGVLRPLFAKTAASGSITAPNFGAGDPTVSARSAAMGDTIQPGESRWYFVSYRDPIALCPVQFTATLLHTFNTTQTGRVVWSL